MLNVKNPESKLFLMNKKQEEIATKLLAAIKENDGLMSAVEINKHPISKLFDFNLELIIFGGLTDLGLIDNNLKSVFRLTEKGWKFKSFKKLYFENSLQLINTKIILIIAIISIILNLFQTFFR